MRRTHSRRPRPPERCRRWSPSASRRSPAAGCRATAWRAIRAALSAPDLAARRAARRRRPDRDLGTHLRLGHAQRHAAQPLRAGRADPRLQRLAAARHAAGHRRLPERRPHQRGLRRHGAMGPDPGHRDPRPRRDRQQSRCSASTPSAARSRSGCGPASTSRAPRSTFRAAPTAAAPSACTPASRSATSPRISRWRAWTMTATGASRRRASAGSTAMSASGASGRRSTSPSATASTA